MVDLILGVVIPFMLFVMGFYLVKRFRNDNIMKYVNIAVKAAEQIFNSQGQGKEKFAYAVKWITAKYKISEEDLKNFIESAVYELNKDKKGEEEK